MFPRNENRNEGTFGCSPGTNAGARVHSHVPRERKPERGYIRQKPPFYETALYLPVNQSIYLHRSGPLLENGLDRTKNRYGRYGFPVFTAFLCLP